MLVSTERERFERIYRELRAQVNEEELAHELARLAFAGHLLSVIDLGLAHGNDFQSSAQRYFSLNEAIDFAAVESALETLSPQDRWERRAGRELAEELSSARVKLTAHLLICADSVSAIDLFRRERSRQFEDAMRLVAELKSASAISLAALQVVIRSISRLAEF